MTTQIAAALVGCWLTAAPDALGYPNPARANDHIVGPLAALVGCVAVFQSTRGVRWANLPLGAWLVVAPWALGYSGWAETAHASAAGAGLIALGCVRGAITERFGGGWASLWRSA